MLNKERLSFFDFMRKRFQRKDVRELRNRINQMGIGVICYSHWFLDLRYISANFEFQL